MTRTRPVVHLELHTADRAAAGAFYARLLRWRPELIETRSGSWLALGLGGGVAGGIVQCGTRRPLSPDARYEQREAVELAFIAAQHTCPHASGPC